LSEGQREHRREERFRKNRSHGAHPSTAHAQAQPRPPNGAPLIGERYLTDVSYWLAPCAAIGCPSYQMGDLVKPGTPFTFLAVGPDAVSNFAAVRLDDGQTGFFLCCNRWCSEAEEAARARRVAGAQFANGSASRPPWQKSGPSARHCARRRSAAPPVGRRSA
jgi:hypothetical protein